MNKHIWHNYHYPKIAQEMGIQGRVRASFIIDKNGSITKILVCGLNKNLEKDAQRIIGHLPKMTRGRPVRVPF
ncbi:energy transducer TonB [Flavobacteriaceae bacterium]|nr:energy transducer TonB [Flavobacteriaceae bacterium]